MAKWGKFYEKIFSGRSRNAIDFDTLISYLEWLGFVEVGGTESHHKFQHPQIAAVFALQPNREGIVKAYQLEQVLQTLELFVGEDKDGWLEGGN